MDIKDHVRGMVSHGGIWVRGQVVQKLLRGSFCFFRSFNLLAGDAAEGHERRHIDGPGVIEDATDDALDLFLLLVVELW